MIGVGLWATSRNKNEADFFLGGRGLGPFVAGLSYAASTSSAWVILGFSGFVFTIGLSALWMVPGIWAGYAVVWLYFGRRLREESSAYQQVTLTDFMLQDAPTKARAKGLATVLAAVLVVFCFVFYVAAQLDAAGSALSENFGMSVPAAIILGAVIVVFYSLLGGFWAVSVTDMVQAAIMMVVSVGVPVAALVAAGGPAEVWSTLSASMPADFLRIDGGHASLVFLGFVVGLVGMSLGALGQPHLLSRLMAVRGEAERRQGFLITFGWGIVVFTGMVTLGLSGRALMPDLELPETLFYRATSSYLPAIVAGIATAAVLSAVMSTVDSLLLAASAAVAHDMGVNRRFPRSRSDGLTGIDALRGDPGGGSRAQSAGHDLQPRTVRLVRARCRLRSLGAVPGIRPRSRCEQRARRDGRRIRHHRVVLHARGHAAHGLLAVPGGPPAR